MKPLDGIRVLDFTQVLAGPICTRFLALSGAEVIKVESRRHPDQSRRGFGFAMLNQNKKGLTLNLTHPSGLGLARDLVRISDVVLENFAPGVIGRLGLGYSVLQELRSDIIMVSCSGLGQTGPQKDRAAYGSLIQLFTGWGGLQGHVGRRPIPGGAWTDPVVGYWETYLIMCALHRRRQTGEGMYIDISLAEATINVMLGPLMDYSMNGRLWAPRGNSDDVYAPHNVYPCEGEDQWLAIAVTSDDQWGSLCDALDLSDLLDNPQYKTGIGRWENQEEIDYLIAQRTRSHATADLFSKLQAAGVPCGPSYNVIDQLNDPHMQASGFFAAVGNQSNQALRTPVVPWRISTTQPPDLESAPELGQHQDYVLKELLHLSDEDIARLNDEGATY